MGPITNAAAASRHALGRMLGVAAMTAVWLCASPEVARGQFVAARTFRPPYPAVRGQFGYAVATDGINLLIGQPGEALGPGTVYLYDEATGALVRTFSNPDPNGGRFGWSIAIQGTEMLVGAPRNPVGGAATGAAYLFDVASGALLQTYTDPTPGNRDEFGWAVAFAGATAVVGTPRDDGAANDAGAVFLFDRASGALLQTLSRPGAAAGEYFGAAVAAMGANVVVGAPGVDVPLRDVGAVLLFDPTGALLTTVANPNPAPTAEEFFGSSVAVLGSVILAGAPGFNSGDGIAYRMSSAPVPYAAPAPMNDEFGWSLAVLGTDAVVGAPSTGLIGAPRTGQAYVFDGASGALQATLANPAPGSREEFGASVAAAGTSVLVGAPLDGAGGTEAGIAYLFSPPGVCGDGTVTAPEQCDDGNLTNGDGCDNDCTVSVCVGGAAIAKARIVLRNVGPPVGDEGLLFRGRVMLPAGTPPAFNAVLEGAQLIVEDATGRAIYEHSYGTLPIPPGGPGTGCDPIDGWLAVAGMSYRYRNRSQSLDPPACTSGTANGLRRMRIADDRALGRGFAFSVQARRADIPDVPGILPPLRGIIVLGATQIASLAGQCGTINFAPANCAWNPAQTQLTCDAP